MQLYYNWFDHIDALLVQDDLLVADKTLQKTCRPICVTAHFTFEANPFKYQNQDSVSTGADEIIVDLELAQSFSVGAPIHEESCSLEAAHQPVAVGRTRNRARKKHVMFMNTTTYDATAMSCWMRKIKLFKAITLKDPM